MLNSATDDTSILSDPYTDDVGSISKAKPSAVGHRYPTVEFTALLRFCHMQHKRDVAPILVAIQLNQLSGSIVKRNPGSSAQI